MVRNYDQKYITVADRYIVFKDFFKIISNLNVTFAGTTTRVSFHLEHGFRNLRFLHGCQDNRGCHVTRTTAEAVAGTMSGTITTWLTTQVPSISYHDIYHKDHF